MCALLTPPPISWVITPPWPFCESLRSHELYDGCCRLVPPASEWEGTLCLWQKHISLHPSIHLLSPAAWCYSGSWGCWSLPLPFIIIQLISFSLDIQIESLTISNSTLSTGQHCKSPTVNSHTPQAASLFWLLCSTSTCIHTLCLT